MREFPQPEGSPERSNLYWLSIACWVAFVFLVFAIVNNANNAYACAYFVFAIVTLVGGIKFWEAAVRADEREAEDMEARVRTRAAEVQAQAEVIKRRVIEEEAVLERELNQIRRETQAKEFRTRQHELDLEQHLISVGMEQGLRANDVSEVNKTKYLSEIKLEENWKLILQDLEEGDLLEIADQQVVTKLTGHLENLYRHRYMIEHGNDPVKAALLARYDKNIRFLEAKIDDNKPDWFYLRTGKKRLDFIKQTDEFYIFTSGKPEADRHPRYTEGLDTVTETS